MVSLIQNAVRFKRNLKSIKEHSEFFHFVPADGRSILLECLSKRNSNSKFYLSRITETYRRTSEAPTLRRSYYQTQAVPDPIQSQIPYLSTPEIFKNIQKTVPVGIH